MQKKKSKLLNINYESPSRCKPHSVPASTFPPCLFTYTAVPRRNRALVPVTTCWVATVPAQRIKNIKIRIHVILL